jgi:hypothetical protein
MSTSISAGVALSLLLRKWSDPRPEHTHSSNVSLQTQQPPRQEGMKLPEILSTTSESTSAAPIPATF